MESPARGGGCRRGDVLTRKHVASGGVWEESGGYSRALAVGDMCYVAGTTDAGPDGESRHPGDAAGQARAAFAIVEGALGEAGFALDDVVRTRVYVTDTAHADVVAAVHGEIFRHVRPAATLLVVAALMRPSLLVEVEATAQRD